MIFPIFGFDFLSSMTAVTVGKSWTHPLSDAVCIDVTTTLSAMFCTPCVFGRNAEALGENCFLYGFGSTLPGLDLYLRATVRGRIRELKGIQGTAFDDVTVVWCCPTKSLVQETLEVRSMNMERS